MSDGLAALVSRRAAGKRGQLHGGDLQNRSWDAHARLVTR
jgi:hypothetical protein